MRPEFAVDVVDVDVVRSQRRLLTSMNLQIEVGEQWVVLGPNGAGKSTLLKLLGAHIHPTCGSVRVLGHQLGRVDMRQLRTLIGHVDPRHTPEPFLTAADIVRTGLTNTAHLMERQPPSDTVRRRVGELLALIGMGERTDLRWATMSQGERTRTLVARALMTQPSLLLLDEPSTGLDVAAREELLRVLGELQLEMPSLSTLLVTHHFEEIPDRASHALLLRNGRTISRGPIDEALSSELVSQCFGHPLHVEQHGGRWSVRSHRSVSSTALHQ
ncbi:ABC transporter ATP-binding protein [Rhodococcus sp. NPDC057297]|uniref:ABC transporter ATP-binding protein n=1 Tax=Rhodococcus sp. NPDC057297 TaxID=3346090 RepID=UPI00363A158F